MFIPVVQRDGAYFAVRSYEFKALMKIEGTNLEEAKIAIIKILSTPDNAAPVIPMRPEQCASPETAVKWGSEIAERLQWRVYTAHAIKVSIY